MQHPWPVTVATCPASHLQHAALQTATCCVLTDTAKSSNSGLDAELGASLESPGLYVLKRVSGECAEPVQHPVVVLGGASFPLGRDQGAGTDNEREQGCVHPRSSAMTCSMLTPRVLLPGVSQRQKL
eukprot:293264-Rhodomonas_salina.1